MKFVKFASHRARDRAMVELKAAGLLKPEAFYSLYRDLGKGIYRITPEHIACLAAKKYPYGKKWYTHVQKPHDDLRPCLNWLGRARGVLPRS